MWGWNSPGKKTSLSVLNSAGVHKKSKHISVALSCKHLQRFTCDAYVLNIHCGGIWSPYVVDQKEIYNQSVCHCVYPCICTFPFSLSPSVHLSVLSLLPSTLTGYLSWAWPYWLRGYDLTLQPLSPLRTAASACGTEEEHTLSLITHHSAMPCSSH